MFERNTRSLNRLNVCGFLCAVLGADPQEASKLFKMAESKICRCREYVCNVNSALQKVLSSWSIYTENINLLKAWLEETRKTHPKKVRLLSFLAVKTFVLYG